MADYIRDKFGYDESGLKEWIHDPKTGNTFTRCDYCGKLYDEMDLSDRTLTINLLEGKVKKIYKLICKKCNVSDTKLKGKL